MANLNREIVLDRLRAIVDNDAGTDIVAADMVRGLVIKGGHVGFSLEVSAARGQRAEPVRLAAEKAVYDIPGVLSVTAVLTAHKPPGNGNPPPQATTTKSIPGALPRHADSPLSDIRSIVAVASGKGGVGKSTVAVNLALALRALGHAVGLLDADIYGPSIPRMLDIKDKPTSGDGKKLRPIEKFGLKTMSIGFLIDDETPMIWRGPMVGSALTQMLNDVLWGDLDFLIVDMPPGTGDAQLTLAQKAALTGAVIVSTPQEIALIDARKAIAMFEKTNVPILGLVENMSYFISPNTEEKSYIFGEGGAKRTAEQAGHPFLGDIPIYVEIRENSDSGTPIVASQPDSAPAACFISIAKTVSRQQGARMAKAPNIVFE